MILNELKLYPDMSDIARQRLKIRMRGILNYDLEVLVIAQLLQIFFRLHLQFGLKRTQQREFHVEYRHSLTVPEKVPQYTETKTNIHEGRSDLSLHFLIPVFYRQLLGTNEKRTTSAQPVLKKCDDALEIIEKCSSHCSPGHSCVPLSKHKSICIDLRCPTGFVKVPKVDLCREVGQSDEMVRFWKRLVVSIGDSAQCLGRQSGWKIFSFSKESSTSSFKLKIVNTNNNRVRRES